MEEKLGGQNSFYSVLFSFSFFSHFISFLYIITQSN